MREMLEVDIPLPPPERGRGDPYIVAFCDHLGGQMNHALADQATAAYVLVGRALEKAARSSGTLVTSVPYARTARRGFFRYPEDALGPWLREFWSNVDEQIKRLEQEERDTREQRQTDATPHGGARTVRQHWRVENADTGDA